MTTPELDDRCGHRGGRRRAPLIYRIHLDRGSGKHRRKGFIQTDYARLLDGVRQQFAGPIVLVWDNLPPTRAVPCVS